MNLQIFAHVRSSLVALGVLAGLSLPAAATPPAVAHSSILPTAVQGRTDVQPATYRGSRYCSRNERCGRYWSGRDKRHYRQHRRYDRRHYRRSYPRYYLGPSYPGYYYAQPRRYYRQGLGSAHVRWCYNRYRSYRAWDNTFQPYHGPRRQCRSPYWP